jgi:hypothetical protein
LILWASLSSLLAEVTNFSSSLDEVKSVCIINSFNSGLFTYMSLWRRGIVLNCHPVGPGSIPGVGAIGLWKNLLYWLKRQISSLSDEVNLFVL